MTDVTIPQDVAKRMAAEFRAVANLSGDDYNESERALLRSHADLLDPPPLSLREQVAEHLAGRPLTECDWPDTWLRDADAILTVVANWLAAQPLVSVSINRFTPLIAERNHDVRLLRAGRAAPDPWKCPAHGKTLVEHLATAPLRNDCAKASDRCQCSVFEVYGLHWDTCPGRGRNAGSAS